MSTTSQADPSVLKTDQQDDSTPAVDAVHKFEGQEPEERQHYQNLWKDPNTTTECKLNAADDAEALPHHGFLAGDL
ncbi:hypothetical protein JCM8097_008509 [Rhodosporidiobolus ruineniae]